MWKFLRFLAVEISGAEMGEFKNSWNLKRDDCKIALALSSPSSLQKCMSLIDFVKMFLQASFFRRYVWKCECGCRSSCSGGCFEGVG